MTTAAQWVEETLGHLLTGQSEERNFLDGPLTASAADTTVGFQDELGGVRRGAYLSIGLEDVWVRDTPSTNTATVVREQRGTALAAHADGDVVQVRPRFPPFRVFAALNAELADLSSPSQGLYRIRAGTDIAYNAAVEGYDLAGVTGLLDVWELRVEAPGGGKAWPVLPRSLWETSPAMDPADFASGTALFIRDGQYSGRTIRLRYKAGFDPLAALTDDVAGTTGLHAEALDIPPIGAAIRLAAGREIRRNFDESEGSSRRMEEVPAGANLAAANALRSLLHDRVRREATRLSVRYPEPGA